MKVRVHRWMGYGEDGGWHCIGELSLFDIDPDMAVAWDRDVAADILHHYEEGEYPPYFEAVPSSPPMHVFPPRIYLRWDIILAYHEGRWAPYHRDMVR